MSAEFAIRAASRADLPDILAIYNEVIRNSTAVFSDKEVSLEDRERWFDAKMVQGFPVLVAADPSGVAGFGTFGEFRSWPGYRQSVEHSVHVRSDRRRAVDARESKPPCGGIPAKAARPGATRSGQTQPRCAPARPLRQIGDAAWVGRWCWP